MIEMLSGEALIDAMTTLPDYDAGIRGEDASVRLVALSDLYSVYLPSPMSCEIYCKLYLALLRSLRKKTDKLAIRQQTENFRAITGHESNGILGGSDSFTIIGVSGIGKSAAIGRAIALMRGEVVIEMKDPFRKLIPCVVVQCPFDASVKGMLLEILRKVDEMLDTDFYRGAMRLKATTDMLIGSVSQVALNHIGLLVVDEIQNVCNSRNGNGLVGMLTQLINNSGISICMVGTPESTVFFEQAMQLARRSLGLKYGAMDCDGFFRRLCETLFSYRYVREASEISEAIVEWLYEHSAGITSVVVSLVHDAQEIAILSGTERLDMDSLSKAYRQRMEMLHDFIRPDLRRKVPDAGPGVVAVAVSPEQAEPEEVSLIWKLSLRAKHEGRDMVAVLREQGIPVTEVEA